jgi:hypothetical protein
VEYSKEDGDKVHWRRVKEEEARKVLLSKQIVKMNVGLPAC